MGGHHGLRRQAQLIDVSWYDARHRDGMVDLVRAVAAQGGAVGWVDVPSAQEVDHWVADVQAQGGRLAVAGSGIQVLASGYWRRQPGVVLGKMGEIRKVMSHPDRRRTGAARAVVTQLVEDARAEGVELLTLECRGNNHGAQRMYVGLGFEITGRRPDAIAVGDERFDQVLMHLDLRTGQAGLVRHGSRREGPGAS